ncbi:hypothetical protein K4Q48_02550 [Staphylococcus epidermidis]|nr:hypothetical protein [Staphylococcus epidermidis]MCG1794002.1 hypothetical protein [Staphylococcus epidermidis]
MLSQKPGHFFKYKTWEDLDQLLQSAFTDDTVRRPKVTIDVKEYVVTADEIENEAVMNLYKVTVDGDYVTFE